MSPKKVQQLALLLELKANETQSTTYVPVAKALGTFSGGRELAEGLGQIQTIDHKNGEPFKSSLVVGVHTGVPGPGYFHMARSLGHKIGATPKDEFEFWLDQMEQLEAQLSPAAIKTGTYLGVLPKAEEDIPELCAYDCEPSSGCKRCFPAATG